MGQRCSSIYYLVAENHRVLGACYDEKCQCQVHHAEVRKHSMEFAKDVTRNPAQGQMGQTSTQQMSYSAQARNQGRSSMLCALLTPVRVRACVCACVRTLPVTVDSHVQRSIPSFFKAVAGVVV